MRTLVFDGRMGASGDMILGALLAAGADPVVLAPLENALDLHYRIETTERNGISATRVRVTSGHGQSTEVEEHDHGDHGHDHEYHEHDHETHADTEGHGPHRSYREVLSILDDLGLPGDVESDAKAVFERLGEAEATVHGTDLESTHFHEVGADDAIADVVGAVLLLDDLDPRQVLTTPLSTGSGTVEMSHGAYPIPPPAVLEIAEGADWSIRGGPVEAELLTPTGAAILAHVAEGVDSLPDLRVDASGYGAGSHRFDAHPNVFRAIVGERRKEMVRERIAVLETNLDDATPEVLGSLQETLAPAGALDVTVVPTTAKKSRPGHLVTVITKPEDAKRVAQKLAIETGTLGVRERGGGHRWIAERTVEAVQIDVDGDTFDVDVKVASMDGEVYDVSAEYDDALAVASETSLAVRDVIRRAETAIHDRNGKE